MATAQPSRRRPVCRELSVESRCVAVPLTAILIAAPLAGAPIGHTDPAPTWSGNYKITFHTDQKSGSSGTIFLGSGRISTPVCGMRVLNQAASR